MDRTAAERIAKRFVSLPLDQRRSILDRMVETGQSFRLLPIMPTRQDAERIPLSYAQQRLLFLWQMEPDSTFYNVPMAVRLRGELDSGAMERALQALVRRHEALRTRFVSVDGSYYQEVLEEAPLRLEMEACMAGLDEDALRARVRDELSRPFDLLQGPLLRAKLLRLADDEYVLTLCMHHIVSDGWSSELMVEEFVQLYGAEVEGRGAALTELPIQYADYAIWQRAWLEAGEGERQLAYWQAQLGDEQPVLSLPLDHERPASPSFRGRLVRADIDPALADRLRAHARGNGHTLFMLVLAAVAVVLSRYSGQADIRIGAPNAGRNRKELEGLIGFFINTQVLRVQVDECATFHELAEQVRAVVAGAQSHQDLPFEQLVDALAPERHLGHNPLFQFKINQNVARETGARRLAGLVVEGYPLETVDAHFDLAFDFTDTPEGIDATFTYATDLFDAATIERLAGSLRAVLETLVSAPHTRLLEHPEVVREVGAPARSDYPCADFLALWQYALEQPAEGHVRCGEQVVGYPELEQASNRLARHLQARGVGTGSIVALCQARSVEWVTAVLAVLKSGGAYLPLDDQQPLERVQQLLDDSGAAMLIHDRVDERFSAIVGARTLAYEPAAWAGYDAKPLLLDLDPQQAAYLIYTSGSTGNPKGVVVSHGALANYLQAVLERLKLPTDASLAMVSTIAADLGHTMLFGALASGRPLHLLAHELAFDPDAFAGYMASHQVAVLKLVPSHLQGLLQAARPADVLPAHALVLGGEACPWPLVENVRQLKPGCRVINHYGPTETTVGMLTHEVHDVLGGSRSVPVGAPLANGQALIFDPYLNPAMPGVAGELYLGGAGLAQGYLGRPALTAERFVPAAFGDRLYRTGDLAREANGSVLEFIGRADDQVKIRGYRVEPGEVTQALLGLAGVKEAVVRAIPLESDRARLQLVAYCAVVEDVTAEALQQALRERLPDYMVPAHILLLERLPLTANGKLDRKALPEAGVATQEHVEPTGEIEEALAAIWAEVLKREKVGASDNFFELGGDSILSLQIIARAKRRGLKLTPKQLFEQQTIRELAQVAKPIEERKTAAAPITAPETAPFALSGLSPAQLETLPIPLADLEDVYPLSPMQEGMLFHAVFAAGNGDYVNQTRVNVDGMDVPRMRAAWQAAVDRHEVLRASFLNTLGRPLQLIQRRVEVPFTELDWRGRADLDSALDDWAQADYRSGFDMEHGPLLRLAVIRIGERTHHLILTMHHILMDGWSNSQLLGEVLQVYAGRALEAQEGHYRDYIQWLGQQDKAQAETFWSERLCQLEEPTLLAPTIRQRGLGEGYGEHLHLLSGEQSRTLHEFARQQRVTLNTLMQAAWLLLLQRYTGQESVSFGATVAGRPMELKGVDRQLGLFINTLPVIASPRPEQSVGEWLRQVQDENLKLREFEHSPLYDIQSWAGWGGKALFDNILVFENYPVADALRDASPEGLVFRDLLGKGQTNYPLTLTIEAGETLSIHYSHDRQHFSEATIAQIAGHFGRLLEALVADAQTCLADLSWQTEDEQCRVIHDWGRAPAGHPGGQCIHLLIEAQVERTPEAVALVFGDQCLSYRQLNQRANRIAHHLRELGVGPDVAVGVALERGLEMVVGLLGILKAGGAYVPLDPQYPAERLNYMMEDSGIRLLLTQSRVEQRLLLPAGVRSLYLEPGSLWPEGYPEENPVSLAEPQNLAYIMYTSGSTGRPKGVDISHDSLSRHAFVSLGFFNLSASDRILQFATFNFDGFVEQLYPALVCGASVVIRGQDIWDSETFYRELIDKDISVVDLTTAYWFLLATDFAAKGPRDYGRLHQVHSGGEAMPPEGVAAWKQAGLGHVRLLNTYGPTEATVTVTAHDCTAYLTGSAALPLSMPVGRPLEGRAIYLLDRAGNLVPCGAVGELVIGGELLARGYHQRPALTAERFIPDPFDEAGGGRLYRTGDLARHGEGGVIEYVGRIDHQVKIRGFRIEPGEIEARLLEQASVREAAVLALDGPNGKQLVGYVVAADPEAIGEDELREELRLALKANLPDYMWPAHLLFLPRLPLSPNGKLDRKALPAPDASLLLRQFVAPVSELEQQVAAAWAEVLKLERVGLADNFFELGGHSLLATQVTGRLQIALGVNLPLALLFEAANLQAYAVAIAGLQPSSAADMDELHDFMSELEAV
ncbi:amino acid adenylation domain-containing protein [Pseudomonas sp. GD04015]|nr:MULTISPECIES: non-ribosomal peptide synthetase [unclassified Pseudomonas]MDG9931286.1 amino acid adenylation domain-containing protein [Pseudomonas sp. GD04042]MDH0485645.1 amino acid adenylation domain-containing protein [Pseudomonas sp. GD04015]MDH0607178.1 amino acid adenylation domain-containing protein [Pseudomonas sp. GD03869]